MDGHNIVADDMSRPIPWMVALFSNPEDLRVELCLIDGDACHGCIHSYVRMDTLHM